MTTAVNVQTENIAMTYGRYTSYRNSEIGWVDKLPSHWRMASLRWLSRRFAGGTPDKDKHEYWDDGTIPWLNSGSVNQRTITRPSALITDEGFRHSSAKWIPRDSLVMALAGQGKTKGMVAHLAIDTTCNQSLAAIVPNEDIHARYLYWWLISNYLNIRNLAGGEQRDGLNLEMVGSIPCPVVPADEQFAIAAFLDRVTAKIDTLIAKKERLIELLQEKLQALISDAVTKGLNPDAPMKDWGIEWLGEVPEHWTVIRVRHLVAFVTSGSRGWAAHYSDDGPLFIRIGNLSRNRIELELDDLQHVQPPEGSEGERTRVEPGDLLVSITAYIGSVGVVPEGLGEAYVNQHIALCRLHKARVNSRWSAYCLSSAHGQSQFGQIVTGGTKEGLALDDVKDLTLLLPPRSEQDAIVNRLDEATHTHAELIASVSKGIARLEEYRTVLISAAVTGKIDVRGEVDAGICDIEGDSA